MPIRIPPRFIPEPKPPPEEPITTEQYLEDAGNLAKDYVARGYWTLEDATEALQTIHQQVTTYGVQGNTLLYEQIVTIPEAEALRRWLGFWYKSRWYPYRHLLPPIKIVFHN